jgi:pimeloyl-ACP methyl ester carboxylesterase
LRKHYVNTELGQVHYLTSGEGKPLLLLHMTPQSSLQFLYTFDYFNKLGFRVIAPDTLGYGMSDKPKQPLSIEEYASVLPQVLEDQDLDTTSVIGHHTGASIACEFAHSHPNRVEKIILHGIPLYTNEERRERMKNLKVDLSPKNDGSHLLNYWNWIQSRVGDRATLESCHMSLLHVFLAGENEWFCHHAAFAYDLKKTLSELKQPCLVITNTGDPLHYIVPRVQSLRADFTFREIEGGSVFFIRDEPEKWVDCLGDFL